MNVQVPAVGEVPAHYQNAAQGYALKQPAAEQAAQEYLAALTTLKSRMSEGELVYVISRNHVNPGLSLAMLPHSAPESFDFEQALYRVGISGINVDSRDGSVHAGELDGVE